MSEYPSIEEILNSGPPEPELDPDVAAACAEADALADPILGPEAAAEFENGDPWVERAADFANEHAMSDAEAMAWVEEQNQQFENLMNADPDQLRQMGINYQIEANDAHLHGDMIEMNDDLHALEDASQVNEIAHQAYVDAMPLDQM